MITNAAKQKLYRERQRDGTIVLNIAIDQDALVEKLIEQGLLDKNIITRDAIGLAAAKVLEIFCKG